MEQEPILNAHGKQEYPPMHTAEHILNATMVRMLGCGRHVNAHVERSKSKLDYDFSRPLTPQEVALIEQRVNEVIASDVPANRLVPHQQHVVQQRTAAHRLQADGVSALMWMSACGKGISTLFSPSTW